MHYCTSPNAETESDRHTQAGASRKTEKEKCDALASQQIIRPCETWRQMRSANYGIRKGEIAG